MRMVGGRSVVTLGVAVVVLLLSGAPAEGHAVLVASEPAAGQRLATAPALVVLRFTEPLNGRLSQATVTDPDGQRFQGGSWGATELRVRLLANAPGVYRVAWATVSVVDGHTLHGGFAFGVGVPVGAGGRAGGGAGTGPGLRDVVVAAGRAAADAALLVAVGMLLLVSLARLDPRLPRLRPRVRLALAVALAAGLAVIVAEAAAAAATAVHGPSVRGMAAYLTSGLAGWARFARVALGAFVVSAGFGLVQAVQQVGTARSLLDSPYGRALGVKALAVAAMVPLSLRAWRRRPTLGPEAALGLTAVALAALLPPTRCRRPGWPAPRRRPGVRPPTPPCHALGI